jgi:hypothetical protein
MFVAIRRDPVVLLLALIYSAACHTMFAVGSVACSELGVRLALGLLPRPL